MSPHQSIAVVETLPMSLSKKIIKFIQVLKTYEDNFLQVSHSGRKLDIPVDATFFSSE